MSNGLTCISAVVACTASTQQPLSVFRDVYSDIASRTAVRITSKGLADFSMLRTMNDAAVRVAITARDAALGKGVAAWARAG